MWDQKLFQTPETLHHVTNLLSFFCIFATLFFVLLFVQSISPSGIMQDKMVCRTCVITTALQEL